MAMSSTYRDILNKTVANNLARLMGWRVASVTPCTIGKWSNTVTMVWQMTDGMYRGMTFAGDWTAEQMLLHVQDSQAEFVNRRRSEAKIRDGEIVDVS